MSVASSSTGPIDASKYQKLAAEYAKLRAQIPVLKKAVLDEQAKNQEISEEVKVKDVSLRKAKQEIDSLTFRNQQLTKRVEFLQENLEESAASGTHRIAKHTSKTHDHHASMVASNGVAPTSQNVIAEELQNKLDENAYLHKQIFDLEHNQEQAGKLAQDRIAVLEEENRIMSAHLGSIKDKYNSIFDQLREEKDRVEAAVKVLEGQLAASKSEVLDYRSRLDKLTPKHLPCESGVISPFLEPAIDCRTFKINVPHTDPTQRSQLSIVFSRLHASLSDLMAGLSNFHTYCEQRAHLYPRDSTMENLTDTCKELISLSRDHTLSLKPLGTALTHLCNEAVKNFFDLQSSDVHAFSRRYADYCMYLNRLMPLLSRSVDEECDVSWCNPLLDDNNRAFIGCWSQVLSTLGDLESVVSLPQGDLLNAHLPGVVDKVVDSLQNVFDAFQALTTSYGAKITTEHQLPVSTKRLKTTNECILASLNSCCAALKQICTEVTVNKDLLKSAVTELADQVPAWSALSQTARSYISSINAQTAVESVVKSSMSMPALMQDASLLQSAAVVSSGLQQQVEEKNKRIIELENEKEHLILETHLLRIKLQQHGGSPMRKTSSVVGDGPASADLLVEDSSLAEPLLGGASLQWMEKHYTDRIAGLLSQVQSGDSKCAYFFQESSNLLNSIKVTQRQKERLKDEVRRANERIANITDDLETTRSGYEAQLRTLSEHLTNLNHTLTAQVDEIQALKQAMNDKVQKKHRFR